MINAWLDAVAREYSETARNETIIEHYGAGAPKILRNSWSLLSKVRPMAEYIIYE